jgi:nucleotide-binding universal stress UspA family protein
MMKRILVPLDGSLLAERALAVAAKLARSTDGTLILVQALTLPVEYGSPFMPEVIPLTIQAEDLQAQAYLTRQVGRPILSGIPIETAVLGQPPAVSILNATTAFRSDMIVMTSHGRTGMGRWVFGSVAEHVVREATVPVLVLREHRPSFWIEGAELVEAPTIPDPVDTFPPLRVLVPLDGTPLAEGVVEHAAHCAVALARGVEQVIRAPTGSVGCSLHFVLILRPFDVMLENLPANLLLTGAETYLKDVANRLDHVYPGLAGSWEVFASNDIASTLVRLVEGKVPAEGERLLLTSYEAGATEERGKYGLLAMATHGRTGISRWVWGSITERVVQKTQLPLLLVHPERDSE